VLIAVRARNPLSLERIGDLLAVVKPENFKIKTVNWLDVKYLDYPASREGLLVLQQPISETPLLTNLAGADADVRAAAIARWQDRVDEWDHYAAQYKSWDRNKWICVGSDYQINGICAASRNGARRFELSSIRSPSGTQSYLMQLGDEPGTAGILRPITGDIDGVAITTLNGYEITAAQR
jgi:hypothetical protein